MNNKFDPLEKFKADLNWIINNPVHGLGVESPSFENVNLKESESYFSGKESKKLGYYYESLIEVLLLLSKKEIIHKSYQVIEDGVTKGELDFIYKSDKIVHLEVACKFYLEYINDCGEVNYLGPDARDSLKKKIERLKNHQLQIITPLKVDERQTHVQIVLFKNSETALERNSWTYAHELKLVSCEDWFSLPKLSWLSGIGGEKVLDWEIEKKKILHSQRACQYAKFENGELVNRLFLVSQSWPL